VTRHAHTPLLEAFAFWRYGGDHGQLAVGARVTRLRDDGLVYAPSYQGWFRPIRMLPIAEGEALLARLEQIRTAYRDAHATLAATTRAQILALLPEARGASSG
jgi:hypothetical protein